jgi:peptidyl-tRNA hydrolase
MQTKNGEDNRLYILMRNDLPSMNAGKAMAQAAHASNQFIHEYGKASPIIKGWQSAYGFGTTIVLQTSGDRVFNICKNAKLHKLPAGHVYDPTYPYIISQEYARLIDPKTHTSSPVYKNNGEVVCFRKELTCGYIFLPVNSPEQIELVGDLSLHP